MQFRQTRATAAQLLSQQQGNFTSVEQPETYVEKAPAQNQKTEPVKLEESQDGNESSTKPSWMKSGVPVRKISYKERRKRRNQRLKRFITPKSALMVLNEMKQGEQINNLFNLNAVHNQFGKVTQTSFAADITIDGVVYKGFGETKTGARNAAAEQAVRDLMIKSMQRSVDQYTPGGDDNEEKMEDEEETLPMSQLASFALYKLFNEWEEGGYKVPMLRGNSATAAAAESENNPVAKPPRKERVLPENAAHMHPCMLLTYMRPHQTYRELGVEGISPPNLTFSVGIEVDGGNYVGKAGNKKEARRRAAVAACQALFGVTYEQ